MRRFVHVDLMVAGFVCHIRAQVELALVFGGMRELSFVEKVC